MSVTVHFSCGGCDATAEGTDRLRMEFRGWFGGNSGFGQPVPVNTPQDVAPPGWMAFDPCTYCCYCPKCAEDIFGEDNPEKGAADD